ncbi:MAG: hypothetical protein DRJ49_00045 [Thermoprotei archaeon]|nr:MAG: hypothetical protein DRJ49_00045 [Thermoprotei archaeon]
MLPVFRIGFMSILSFAGSEKPLLPYSIRLVIRSIISTVLVYLRADAQLSGISQPDLGLGVLKLSLKILQFILSLK